MACWGNVMRYHVEAVVFVHGAYPTTVEPMVLRVFLAEPEAMVYAARLSKLRSWRVAYRRVTVTGK